MQENIKAEIKKAMIAKEMDRLGVLRMLSAAFTNELVSIGKMPTDLLTDDEAIKVIKKEVKKRKDSIDQFTTAGRPELAESETAEMVVLEEFLPAQMSREEIVTKISAKLAESPIDPTKKGQFVGTMLKELGSNADGSLVKEVIDELVK
ncbi:MAG: GatB/YqeY domain-containing protein [Candidatus Nomurabacteria bacterium]